jgi:hypothetical protein
MIAMSFKSRTGRLGWESRLASTGTSGAMRIELSFRAGVKLARPERFELPTYCSGVVPGQFTLGGSQLQTLGNSESVPVSTNSLQLHLSR